MSGSVTLTVTIEENGVSTIIEQNGVSDEAIVPLLILAVVSHATGVLKTEIATENPTMADWLIASLAASQARLAVVHEIMHLPEAEMFGSVLDLSDPNLG